MSERWSSLAFKVAYKIRNAPVRPWPFPHIVIEDFLPEELYQELAENWPHKQLRPISEVRPVKGYSARTAWHFNKDPPPPLHIWNALMEIMHDPCIRAAFASLFPVEVRWSPPLFVDHPRMKEGVIDSLLVEDHYGYSIGPHTDAPAKLCSAVLYFSTSNFTPSIDLGTSLYVSKEYFTCAGGPHYDRASHGFEEIYRVPYVGNTLMLFLKGDNSFHGVEPVPIGAERRVYIWNLRTSEVGNASTHSKPIIGTPQNPA